MKAKPVCQALRPWLKENLGPNCLGVLTGTDSRALDAAVHIVELIAFADRPAPLMQAFGAVVTAMQPTARHLAFHAIAHVLDWSDRSRIWDSAGLPWFPVTRCKHEGPQGPEVNS